MIVIFKAYRFWCGILFWLIGSYRGIRQYYICHTSSVMSSLLHNHSFHVYNRPAARRSNLIISMEFTINSCSKRTSCLQRNSDTRVGEELACRHEEGNPNDVYTDTERTDSGIVVGQLPRKISKACSLFLWRSGMIMCQVKQTAAERH